MISDRIVQVAIVADSGLLLTLLLAVMQVTYALGQLRAKIDTMWQWYLDEVKKHAP
jgi:hypothetical protein